MKLPCGVLFALGLVSNVWAQFGAGGFSDSDTDDMDYNSLLAMPSADVLAQLIALSQANNAASGGGNKKKKNKGNRQPRTT